MAISKKITDFLEKKGYKFQIVDHKTTFTAWDVAQTEKIKPSDVVKALALKGNNDYFVALIPADKKLDKAKFLKFINGLRKKSKEKAYPKVDFAKEAWMKKNLPGKLGAIPPFSGILKVAIYADKLLSKKKFLYLGSGNYETSLRISAKQYFKLENPAGGSFGQKR
jgi:prolyl-tRNA editing enzyme YbaK/EbsC (Cys-tRNA(Pro) deacylase)